jgi:hypothetical protein
MSQDKNFHSLPKKLRPKLSTSNKLQTTAVSKAVRQEEGCPEISEFKAGKANDELYVHRLDIDYGRLERPNHFYFDGPQYKQVVKMADLASEPISNEEMCTKRVTGISSLAAELNLQERDTEKKDRRFTYVNQKTEESRPTSNVTSCKKVKIKLTEVKAYEQLTKRDSSVKRLHSRIVKMMVGGGKVTTKVISYPDNE